MDFPKKQLLVVGDRVLIAAEDGDERTRVGLYLPATAIDSQQVQTGLIVATGPGDPVADISSLDDEPWKTAPGGQDPRHAGAGRRSRHLLPQGRSGDTFEEKKYLVVPQAAILVLIRDDLPI